MAYNICALTDGRHTDHRERRAGPENFNNQIPVTALDMAADNIGHSSIMQRLK